MADSWGPRHSATRRLRRTQQAMIPGTLNGRLRQAAPVPPRIDHEPPPFNMHVGDTPPEDIYIGRAWMDTSGV
jgi:hypothetical protein